MRSAPAVGGCRIATAVADAEKTGPEASAKLLISYAGPDLAAYMVSTKVNNARYDGEDCVAAAA